MDIILKMYISLAAPIFSGIFNMIFIKSKLLRSLNKPIDGGKSWVDGRPIFGPNKTWRGLVGYIIINTIVSILWGMVCGVFPILEQNHFLYEIHENTIPFNALVGALFGIGYSVFELPNSFLKRRFQLTPGKTANNQFKWFFVAFDQADSVIGCSLVLWLFYPLGIGKFIAIILLGAITHLLLNMLLYVLKLRKNMF